MKNEGNLEFREQLMNNEDRRLLVETLGEMRELKGEMKEFKEHVIGRVHTLEKKEAERSKERLTVIGILISSAALAVSFIANFFRHRG
ncbi:hypothetical protein FACS1894161_1070 [Spirochaetia bacterium]|nr:hypothetical protein FACS1894161_1070 [Spirochaetia bacterium]